MKKYLLVFALFIISKYQAQNLRFFYELEFKKDSTSNDLKRDSYILDVTKKEQKFYNYEFLKNDSIQKAKNSDYIFSYPNLAIRLIHRKNKSFESYFSETPQYYFQKTSDKQNWNIESEKKKIGNYTVQKATTNFGGRNWVAWFTSEIPLNFGPYKFYGLPGLILEIYDTKQNFKFTFKGNENLRKEENTLPYLETLNGQKPTEVNETQRQKLKIDYYINPLKDFQDGMIVENDKGEKVKVNVRELTEKQQKYLKQYNNPIELDTAIKCPN